MKAVAYWVALNAPLHNYFVQYDEKRNLVYVRPSYGLYVTAACTMTIVLPEVDGIVSGPKVYAGSPGAKFLPTVTDNQGDAGSACI